MESSPAAEPPMRPRVTDPMWIGTASTVKCKWRMHLHKPIQFACGRLIETCLLCESGAANGVQEPQNTQAICIPGVLRHLKRHLHVALCTKVIQLIRLHFGNDFEAIRRVGQVAIVQMQSPGVHMRILIQVLNAPSIERRGSTDDPMHNIVLFEKQFRQIGTILACDASDEGHLEGRVDLLLLRGRHG